MRESKAIVLSAKMLYRGLLSNNEWRMARQNRTRAPLFGFVICSPGRDRLLVAKGAQGQVSVAPDWPKLPF